MDQEQNATRFVPVLSLRETATLRIMLRLFQKVDTTYPPLPDDDDDEDGNEDLNYYYRIKTCEVVEHVKNKLFCLPLPIDLIQEMSCLIRPVASQLFALNVNYPSSFTSLICVGDLHLTSIGTIDEPAMIEDFILENEIDKDVAFVMFDFALRHCLVECVFLLMQKFPELLDKCFENIHKVYLHLLVYFIGWDRPQRILPFIIKTGFDGIYDSNASLDKNMFLFSIYFGFDTAGKYFWLKLTDEERKKENLVLYIDRLVKDLDSYKPHTYSHNRRYSQLNLLFFLLSQMTDPKQQEEAILKNGESILELMLCYWPWQKYLVQTIEMMFQNLDGVTYAIIMERVAQSIEPYSNGKALFEEIWSLSPSNLKKCYLEDVVRRCGSSLFFNLMLVDNFHTIKTVLIDASDEQKKMITFTVVNDRRVNDLIKFDKVGFLDLLFNETLHSENDIDQCRNILLDKWDIPYILVQE